MNPRPPFSIQHYLCTDRPVTLSLAISVYFKRIESVGPLLGEEVDHLRSAAPRRNCAEGPRGQSIANLKRAPLCRDPVGLAPAQASVADDARALARRELRLAELLGPLVEVDGRLPRWVRRRPCIYAP